MQHKIYTQVQISPPLRPRPSKRECARHSRRAHSAFQSDDRVFTIAQVRETPPISGVPGADAMAAPPLDRFYERTYIQHKCCMSDDRNLVCGLVRAVFTPQTDKIHCTLQPTLACQGIPDRSSLFPTCILVVWAYAYAETDICFIAIRLHSADRVQRRTFGFYVKI